MVLLHSEVGATVGYEHIEFLEATLVEQHEESLSCSEFSFFVLGVDPLLTAAQTRLFPKGYQRLYFFELLTHNDLSLFYYFLFGSSQISVSTP